MAKSIVGTVAKIAAKRAIGDVAKQSSARARASSPIPAMAIGLATSFLTKRLLPVKIAGIGGIILASVVTKLLLDRRADAADAIPETKAAAQPTLSASKAARKPATKRPATP